MCIRRSPVSGHCDSVPGCSDGDWVLVETGCSDEDCVLTTVFWLSLEGS